MKDIKDYCLLWGSRLWVESTFYRGLLVDLQQILTWKVSTSYVAFRIKRQCHKQVLHTGHTWHDCSGSWTFRPSLVFGNFETIRPIFYVSPGKFETIRPVFLSPVIVFALFTYIIYICVSVH